MSSPPSRPLRAHGPGLLFLALAGAGLGSGCAPSGSKAGGPGMGGAKAPEIVRVRVVALEQRPIASTIETVGTLESRYAVDLYPEVSGVVTRLELPRHEEGAHVAAGEVLAELDSTAAALALRNAEVALREAEQEFLQLFITLREARAQLARAQDAFDEAEREYGNARRQVEQGLLSADELEKRRFEWDQSSSDLQVARIGSQRISAQVRALALKIERARHQCSIQRDLLEDHRIVAPFAGVLRERMIQEGQLVTPTTPAFGLIDEDELELQLDRPQRERALIAIGQVVELLPSRSDLPMLVRTSGRSVEDLVCQRSIVRIAPANVPGAGTFRVTVGRAASEAPTADAFPLYHGRSVRVRIILEEKDSPWLLPKKAVLREGGRSSVFVVRGETARRVALEPGFSDDSHVEALNLHLDGELSEEEAGAFFLPDDRIVLLGMDELENGTRVEIVE